MSSRDLLRRAAEIASDYLEGLPERPVGSKATVEEMRRALGGALPEAGESAESVLESLARAADPGIVATAGPRYFGFVVGGTLPVTVAADWLTSTWDQNAGLFVLSPANSVAEETAGGWLRELFGLPAGASVGFVTGCQAANFSALAAARHALSQRFGWDVEARGLYGAPEIEVVVGAEAHVTVHTALQMLGLGRERVHRVAVDGQGRMLPADARRRRSLRSPGARRWSARRPATSTPGRSIRSPRSPTSTAPHGAWLHVDGAFGLWAGTSPELAPPRARPRARRLLGDRRPQVAERPLRQRPGLLRPPGGAPRGAHRPRRLSRADRGPGARSVRVGPRVLAPGARLHGLGGAAPPRPERRRRPRRALLPPRPPLRRAAGDAGARRDPQRGRAESGAGALHAGVAAGPGADAAAGDEYTREVIRRVQADGTCWLSGTTWRGQAAMRISVSNWSTTEADVDRSAAAIRRAAELPG